MKNMSNLRTDRTGALPAAQQPRHAQDNWGTDHSKGSWGGVSRGGASLSLNNEAAYSSLPDILRSRAENVDAEDIERGSLLGRG